MRVRKQIVRCGVAVVITLSVAAARADVFNMPAGQTSLSFVPVGDVGNLADSNGYGSVDYPYQMGTYDVTVGQYCQFLNAVAKTDSYGLYSTYLASGITTQNYTTQNGFSGPYISRINITRSGTSGNYSYTVGGTDVQAANCPIFDVNWGDAARFCNWLQNNQPSFAAGTPSDVVAAATETGAYTLNGANSNSALLNVVRNPGAAYFIPTLNEWYKAAYYKGNGSNAGYYLYPTQSSNPPNNVLSSTATNSGNYYTCATCSTDIVNELTPVGAFAASSGPYGTFDQGGDINQWTETTNADGSMYNARGGDWDHYYTDMSARASGTDNSPMTQDAITGFRVAASASVPEPGSISLLLVCAASLLAYAWRRTAAS